ncbi:MAG TPA: RpiB/LacA/LacB family sugar-phosphate isomerase [Patescibacteria group bacterium]|nr:RpiB/LacA/LacB family sugar-phosphate isomerase [Patescibacteria group bacterium]
MKIYLGSDHRGFALKNKIATWLESWNYEFEDLGPDKLNPDDDYTTYASSVAKKVSEEKNCLGILLCGSGVGVDITANKFHGIRAGIGKTQDQVKAAKNDDNINILVLASDFTTDEEAQNMLKVFLETKFDNLPRHERRLEEIKNIEDNKS